MNSRTLSLSMPAMVCGSSIVAAVGHAMELGCKVICVYPSHYRIVNAGGKGMTRRISIVCATAQSEV